ncbi:MAG: outer membrane protein assembly factor BamD [Planctomycetes bacterium]|nr:outer membrane protein assembly factor BamD [Planctomycetota bacterium]
MKSALETALRASLAVAALGLLSAAAAAGIVWTPEKGWCKSPDTEALKGSAEFDRAFELYVAGKYSKSSHILENVVETAAGPLKEDASILLAECLLGKKDYRGALAGFGAFARDYPGSRHLSRAMEGQLEIARALLSGEKIRLFALRIWPAYWLGEKAVDKIASARPLSIYARKAQMVLARSYFRRRLYIEAAATYRQAVELFPNGPHIAEALLGLSRSYIEDTAGPGYNPLPYYGSTSVARDLLRTYPASPEAKAALDVETKAAIGLSRHYFAIAKWYLKMGKTNAAVVYFGKVSKEYPQTRCGKRAKVLVETLSGTAGDKDGK